jgi:hypothetical protein
MSDNDRSWVWCEDCLDWKDAGDETSFVNLDEEFMTFVCDKCNNENISRIYMKDTKPKSWRALKRTDSE